MEAGEDRVRAELGISTLSDAELLANTRALIGRSNQVLAALLVHLGEVDARGLYRQRACSSLFAYCLYELRLSEDEAVRRVAAARLARKFPEVLDAVAADELHLTGLLLLGPHLNRENLREVMARAKHRTKKEIAKLVRILDPLPDVPARIEALGPLHPGVPRTNPTWAEQVASFCPVRELSPGDRPRDWVEPDALPAPARVNDPRDSAAPNDVSALARVNHPLRFKVQFSTTDEYVDLMERAAALLSNHREPNGIEEIHLRALRILVERLEKRRFGAPARPATSVKSAESAESAKSPKSPKSDEPARLAENSQEASKNVPKPSCPPSRHIPARVRRAVFERDGARCTHADSTAQRCRETRRLELHHLVPFARGGEHTVTNLTLRCAPHNALAAELDFSPEHIARQRDSCRHTCEGRASRETTT